MRHRQLSFVLFTALLSACAIGYRQSYREQRLGDGRYLLTTRANELNRSGDAYHFAYARAQELCPEGFDVLQQDGSSLTYTEKHKTGTGKHPGNDLEIQRKEHEVVLLVQCTDAAAAAAPDDDDEPAVADDTGGQPAARVVDPWE